QTRSGTSTNFDPSCERLEHAPTRDQWHGEISERSERKPPSFPARTTPACARELSHGSEVIATDASRAPAPSTSPYSRPPPTPPRQPTHATDPAAALMPRRCDPRQS